MLVRFEYLTALSRNELKVIAKKINNIFPSIFEDFKAIKLNSKSETILKQVREALIALDNNIYSQITELYGVPQNKSFVKFFNGEISFNNFVQLYESKENFIIDKTLLVQSYRLAKQFKLPYASQILKGFLGILKAQHISAKKLEISRKLAEKPSLPSVQKTDRSTQRKEGGKTRKPIENLVNNRKKTRKQPSVYSPNLLNQFRHIGYIDQNGHTVLGNAAEKVLTELWQSEDKRLSPPLELKDSGLYYIPARIEIQPDIQTIETENGVIQRPIYIAKQPTLHQGRSKLSPIQVNGFNSKIRVLSLKPLWRKDPILSEDGKILGYSEEYLDTDRILSIHWQTLSSVDTKKPQNLKEKNLSKPHTKTKINWGSKYLGVSWDSSVTHSIHIQLPKDPSKESISKPYRMVLDPQGNISLYHNDGILYGRIGSYTVKYNPDNPLAFDILGKWDLKQIPNHWPQVLDRHIHKLIYSNSRIVSKLVSEDITTYNHIKFSKQIRTKLSKRQYRRLICNAKKVGYQWLNNPEKKNLLPVDVQKALKVLGNDFLYLKKDDSDILQKDKSITEKERHSLNTVVIAWYQTEILGTTVISNRVDITKPEGLITVR